MIVEFIVIGVIVIGVIVGSEKKRFFPCPPLPFPPQSAPSLSVAPAEAWPRSRMIQGERCASNSNSVKVSQTRSKPNSGSPSTDAGAREGSVRNPVQGGRGR